jgi:hypothetical protein
MYSNFLYKQVKIPYSLEEQRKNTKNELLDYFSSLPISVTYFKLYSVYIVVGVSDPEGPWTDE